MNPVHFQELIVQPSLTLLDKMIGIPYSKEAYQMVMTIAGQESNWDARKQYGGPARSYWQFEKGGGVWGVLNHASTANLIRDVCEMIDIEPCNQDVIYEAMAWSSFLGCTMARLLLFTDPSPLPAIGAVDQAWEYYQRNWRPGAPHPETWPGHYQTSLNVYAELPESGSREENLDAYHNALNQIDEASAYLRSIAKF